MADFSAMLAQAAAGSGADSTPIPTPIPTPQAKLSLVDMVAKSKQADVAAASANKIADLGGPIDYKTAATMRQTGAGVATAEPGITRDLATLSYPEIQERYGDAAVRGLLQAQSYRNLATTGTRDDHDLVTDLSLGTGLGMFNSVAGPAALIASAVNDKAGAYLAQKIGVFNDAVSAKESPVLQAKCVANAEHMALQARDNAAIVADKPGSFATGLRRVGSDFLDSAGNIIFDPTLLSDTVSQGLGSLLTAGPIGKGLAAIGEAVLPTATRKGVTLAAGIDAATGAPSAARALDYVGSKLPSSTLVGIGAQEGGGAYQQTAADIANTSHEDLTKNSPYYRDLVAQGMDPEQARAQTANRAGLFSAAVQTPLAMATGHLTEHFEAAPFHVPNLKTAAQNFVKEGLEEGIQSGTGQVAQNLGAKLYANENQDLLDGVGDQIAQGAIGGAGSAGVTQAPGIAGKAAVRTIMGTGKAALAGLGAVGKASAKSADEVRTKNDATSPVADATMRTAADELATQTPEASTTIKDGIDQTQATPEAKAEGNDYVDKLMSANQFTDQHLEDLGLTEPAKAIVSGSKDGLEAMQRLGDVIKDKSLTTQDTLSAALALKYMQDDFQTVSQSDPKVLNDLPEDHPAIGLVQQYGKLVANLSNTPRIQNALAAATNLIEAHAANIAPVTEESLATPEGQQNAQTAIKLAEVAPDKANLEVNNQILAHASQGRIHLTQAQNQALVVSNTLLQAAKTASDEQADLGHRTPLNAVSDQIQTDPSMKASKLSATAHGVGVFQAVREGNISLATDRLKEFGNFATHMSNKVDAINDHYDQGGGPSVPYEALNPQTREWYTDKVGLGITPTSPKSIEFAQRAGLEAQRLADIHNGLSKAFPALNGGQIEASQLNPALQGKPGDVAQAFNKGEIVRPALKAQATESKAQPKTVATQGAASTSASETKSDTETAAKIAAKPIANENAPKATALTEKVSSPEETASSPKEIKPSTQAVADTKTPANDEATHAINDATVKATNEESTKEVTTEAKAEPIEQTKPQGMDAAYPALIGSEPDSKIINRFKAVFKLPKDAKTNIIGTESPLKEVKDALTSGSHDLPTDVVRAYKGFLNVGSTLGRIMDQRLQAYLNNAPKTGAGAGQTLLSRFLDGKLEANRLVDGKALNITEPDGKGGLRYNQELKESAILAGLQWLLSSSNYESVLDEQAASNLTGIPVDMIDDTMLERLNQGLTTVAAKRTLADKIKQFWGLEANRDAPAGYVEGIPEAMAAELLEAMLENDDLKVSTVELTEADGLPVGSKPKTLDFFAATRDKDGPTPLTKFPSLIEKGVLTEPEDVHYFGDARLKVAQTQLRNPVVQNTTQQKAMIGKEQETPHFFSQPMVDLYQALGLENILRLFGAGELGDRTLNVNHAKSLEGKNRTITGAYNAIMNLLAETTNEADKGNVDLDQVPIHYAYNVNKVGRLQMLGRYNPQSTKLVREVILPTRSTLDLSTETGKDYQKFALGLAQALGVKVHKMSLDSSIQKVEALLKGALAPSVDALRDFTKTGKLSVDATDTLLENFKSINEPLTNVALHALAEYARYQETQDKSKFTTPIYVEADGVTNGPVNAMSLLSFGRFTKDWVNRMAKGGLFFHGPKTMNEQHTGYDAKDMYQTTTDNLKVATKNLRDSIKDVAVTDQLNHLNTLMDLFLPDFTIQEDGTLELNRGIAKNPLTITIYGSGEKGIAGNISGAMLDSLYEKMSEAAETKKFLGGDEAKIAKFQAAYDALTSNIVVSRKGILSLAKGENVSTSRNFDPKTFTVSPAELKNLNANVHRLFVGPLREAITQTIGQPLMDAAKLLQQATQIQSLFQEHAFNQAVRDLIAEKTKTDPRAKAEGLSQTELSMILQGVIKQFPMVQTASQKFFIAGSQSTDVNTTAYGNSLTGGFRTDGFVYGPTDAGVAGIPTTIIGMGDGQMMQTLATMRNAPKGSLKIFDGVNFPLNQLEQSSRQANEAVHEAWQGNPLQSVSDAFNASLEHMDIKDAPQKLVDDILRTLVGPNAIGSRAVIEIGLIKALGLELEKAALSVEARHNAMNQVAHSIDQMAAAGSPYEHEGTELKGTNDEEIAGELNRLYQVELAKLQKGKVAESVLAHKEQDQPKIGTEHASGARVFNYTNLTDLGKLLNLSPTQQAVYDRIQISQAAKDYKVVYGKIDQLWDYADQEGLGFSQEALSDYDRSTHGLTVTGDKTIYLFSPSKETLVHELIHAATFETVAAHYAGQSFGERTSEVTGAVQRLENLMKQFQSDNFALGIEDPQTARIYYDALAQIREYQNASSDPMMQAAALNEFMAWGLANHKLAEVQSKVKASPLAQFAKDIMAALKTLIFGKAKVSAPADDMLSNLLFNTHILIQSQPTLQAQIRDTNLSMSTRYGDSDRLAKVNEAFGKKVVDYVEGNPADTVGQVVRDSKVQLAIANASNQVMTAIWKGFVPTPQAQTTFHSIVSALATEAQIHPGSLSEAERLFTHVTKNLTVEQFMADPNSLDPAMRYDAQQKYSMIVGDFGTTTDEQGRSSLLPVFLGLAITDDIFREVLSKIPLPKSATSDGSTMDGILENVGNTIMDKLTQSLAGTVRTHSVQQAIDALARQIQQVAQDRQTILDQVASPAGSQLDRLNEAVRSGIGTLADAASKSAETLNTKYNNRLTKLLAASTAVTADIVNEGRADKVAQGVMSFTNNLQGWAPIRELISDFVGRTESNKGILDLIKTIKSDSDKDRQQYREAVPGIMAEKFSRKLTPDEWTSMFKGMGKTDLAALVGKQGLTDTLTMLHDQTKLSDAIDTHEEQLKKQDATHWNLLQTKMQQLAHFMNTGEPGRNLLRNAEAVAHLLGEKTSPKRAAPNEAFIHVVNQLTTLYALKELPQEHKDRLTSLVQSEPEGVGFALAYLIGQRKDEMAKTNAPRAMFNYYKGHIPSLNQDGRSLIVANDIDASKLLEKSYVRVGDYVGSAAEGATQSKGYYFIPLSARSPFTQGLIRNVTNTSSGVETVSGFTDGMTAGRIADAGSVARITSNLAREGSSVRENLLPVYNSLGKVVAYERSVDPNQLRSLNQDTHLGKMIGVWRGRQVEEAKADVFNKQIVDRLRDMYNKDIQESSSNKSQYVNLFNAKDPNMDPITKDAISLIPQDTLAYARSQFGKDAFYVRRDMLNDALGARRASIGDMWTGTSRWSPTIQSHVQNLAVAAFGNKAYKYLNMSEREIQGLVKNVKSLIVVKSIIVPVANFVSNIYMMLGRGIPIQTIIKSLPNKLSETHTYQSGQLREIKMGAELRAAEATNDVIEARKLKAGIQSLQDSYKRMTIWPLIQSGELSTVSDLKLDYGDLKLSGSRLSDYMGGLVDKLPKSMQTAGRYAIISKDTALYAGLQKSVEWGDFLAKAIMYDHLTQKKGLDQAEALGRVSEEFVNYARLSGRFREYTEAMGLLWFYNFKIRATKVALATVRENPVHALLTTLIPAPPGLNSVGTALEDNIVAKAWKGTLGWSVGPRMEFHAPMLNPWINLAY